MKERVERLAAINYSMKKNAHLKSKMTKLTKEKEEVLYEMKVEPPSIDEGKLNEYDTESSMITDLIIAKKLVPSNA